MPKENIVDTALGATENGFDESRQVVVSFPQVKLGSRITFKIREKIFKPYIEGHFSHIKYFGFRDLIQKSEIKITSERKLFFEINDPQKKINFAADEKRNKFTYTLQLNSPLVHWIIDEKRSTYEDKSLTWMVVSTAPTYSDMYLKMSKRYEELLNQTLPVYFSNTVIQARSIKKPIDQINFVLSHLADSIRYMGDWRAVDGGFVPRSIKTIAESRFGDCKDMSLVTVKILRELGLKAFVALTYRSTSPNRTTKVPFVSVFNHAIVWVNLEGRNLWLDPTNFYSFADGVSEDIGNREGLILNPSNLELKFIEFSSRENNRQKAREVSRIISTELLRRKMSLDYSGVATLLMIGAELRYSKEYFEESSIANLTDASDVRWYKFDPWNLKSRIVQPIHVTINIESLFHPYETSRGSAISSEAPEVVLDMLKVIPSKRDSSIKLEIPQEWEYTSIFENAEVVGNQIKSCKVHSPWLDYEFNLKNKPLSINRITTIKTYSISPEEVKSPPFAQLQKEVASCGKAKYVIFKKF